MRPLLLLLALVVLPGCDAVSSIFDSLSAPSVEDLADLSTLFGCDVEGLGGSESGSLAGGDCTIPSDGSLVDLYAFRLSSETDVRITLTSDDFTPYVLLYDDNVNLLDQSGAEPGDDSVELEYLLNDGLFVVAANSREAGETGRYTIRVERR